MATIEEQIKGRFPPKKPPGTTCQDGTKEEASISCAARRYRAPARPEPGRDPHTTAKRAALRIPAPLACGRPGHLRSPGFLPASYAAQAASLPPPGPAAPKVFYFRIVCLVVMTAKTSRQIPKERGCDVPRGARTVAGVAGGAVFGFAVGGPAGAMFGGMAGLIIGASSDVGAYMDKW